MAKSCALQQLETDFKQFNVHIGVITETWFKPHHDNQYTNIPGYYQYRKDRAKRKGGGIAVYVHSDLVSAEIHVHPDGYSENIEITWVHCEFGNTVYYLAACYHPPRPHYCDDVLKNELSRDLDVLFKSNMSARSTVVALTGDFNSLDTEFLTTDYGLSQLVDEPTHGKNTLDKFFTSRPDLFEVSVFCSLLKTKHKVVFAVCAAAESVCGKRQRNKILLADRREHNINFLRYCLGLYDWKPLLYCSDIQIVYDNFLAVIEYFLSVCIPVHVVRIGFKDPDYVTPLIRTLLNKRNRMRKQGNVAAADDLAARINVMIADNLRHRLNKVASANVSDMWNAIHPTRSSNRQDRASHLLVNLEHVNNHFANISYDPNFDPYEVLVHRQTAQGCGEGIHLLNAYEVEPMLRQVKKTSPGKDKIPFWVFSQCSVELADIVAHIYNLSLSDGVVPAQWLTAVITPVPKISNPSTLSDFRPISVTPILSRILEKYVVRRWLRPAISVEQLSDQFGFKPTGSTTCALVYFMHYVTQMLETSSYVRCLLIDFSKAFDVVDHGVLVAKLSCLPLPPSILNWLISFLSGRNHTTKTSAGESTPADINRSIVQGSGLGPTLYLILESDLEPKSRINKIFKYADDTNLLVPELTDVELCDEFLAIQNWAQINKMIINIAKTKELVFRRPNPRLTLDVHVITGVERVCEAKLLGVIFKDNLKIDSHVSYVLRICSQRLYLLKQLRDQGLSSKQLDIVFQSIIIMRIAYAAPAWSSFVSKEQEGKIDAFLRRSFRLGFSQQIFTFRQIAEKADHTLFTSVTNPTHCLHQLLPPTRSTQYMQLRDRGHSYTLPTCTFQLYKNSFINRCLFEYIA